MLSRLYESYLMWMLQHGVFPPGVLVHVLTGPGAFIRSGVAIACGVILIFIVRCIWTSREKQPPCNTESPEDDLLFFERGARRFMISSWATTFKSSFKK